MTQADRLTGRDTRTDGHDPDPEEYAPDPRMVGMNGRGGPVNE